ncbi:hypothetical protein B5C34_04730 [Pacificimonas flava]|uniref:CidA/LrgA family protein n=2 Tax=Pacificimonas TaxID=1960290 RepID=A0A219B3R0_9SPHN|nr:MULTISPECIES: CidA/LrgA family protein [Pacificimonas]MBZ6377477.1 CidA/LrgA family protein [Pacificimonas aurantium]OWV32824.1 hypothetical protein B5C34_04730 [Pacificimonas flava]
MASKQLGSAATFLGGVAALFLAREVGVILALTTGLPVPAAVLGLLLIALASGVSPWLRRLLAAASSLFVRWLGAFIVPPFVGLAMFLPLLGDHGPVVFGILVLTTLLGAGTTAGCYLLFRSRGVRA